MSSSTEPVPDRHARKYEQRLHEQAAAAGLRLYRRPNGIWHLLGPGVDVLTADLQQLTPLDLKPHRYY